MSYDPDNSYESNRHHQGGRHHQGHQQESRRQYGDDNDSEFRSNRDDERDGYAETGGYGPESMDPEYGQRQRRQQQQREEDRFGGGSDIPGSYGRGSRISESRHQQQQRNEDEQEYGGSGRRDDNNEYSSGSGRRVVGSGVNSVELSSRRGGGNQGQEEFGSDMYGGEGMTDYGDRTETHQGRQTQPSRTTESTGYGGQGNERRQQQQQQQHHQQGRQQAHEENENRHGRDHVGFGVDTVSLTGEGDSRRSGDLYGGESNMMDDDTPQSRPNRNTETSGYGGQGGERRQQQPPQQQHQQQRHQGKQQQQYGENEDRHGRDHVGSGVDTVALTGEGDIRRAGDMYGGESNMGGGEYDVSSGGKYTPGAKVVLHAAEMETEKNPYNDLATGFAGETQNYLKEELKELGKEFLQGFGNSKR